MRISSGRAADSGDAHYGDLRATALQILRRAVEPLASALDYKV
jgi:hypothetical protein